MGFDLYLPLKVTDVDYSTHPVFITRTSIEWDRLLGKLSVIDSRELWEISFSSTNFHCVSTVRVTLCSMYDNKSNCSQSPL